jgi:hypothetical protein
LNKGLSSNEILKEINEYGNDLIELSNDAFTYEWLPGGVKKEEEKDNWAPFNVCYC